MDVYFRENLYVGGVFPKVLDYSRFGCVINKKGEVNFRTKRASNRYTAPRESNIYPKITSGRI
jgi:hypothetical protein